MRRLCRIAFSERSFRLIRFSIFESRHSGFAAAHARDASAESATCSPSSVCTLPGSPALNVPSTFAGTCICSSSGIHTHDPASNAAMAPLCTARSRDAAASRRKLDRSELEGEICLSHVGAG